MSGDDGPAVRTADLHHLRRRSRARRMAGQGPLPADLTPDELKELEAAITTQLATTRPVPRFPTPEEQDALPRRLLYAPAACGGAGYWHSTPAGLDATGRPGNVFVHVVLDRRPEVPEPAFRPSDLWRSRGWLTPFGHSQVLAAVPAGPPPWPDGVLDRARVLDFLFEPGRLAGRRPGRAAGRGRRSDAGRRGRAGWHTDGPARHARHRHSGGRGVVGRRSHALHVRSGEPPVPHFSRWSLPRT